MKTRTKKQNYEAAVSRYVGLGKILALSSRVRGNDGERDVVVCDTRALTNLAELKNL